MIAAAGQSAELAHLTKDAVLLAASQYRNLPPHQADATSADQAYRHALATGPVDLRLYRGHLGRVLTTSALMPSQHASTPF